VPTSYEVGYFFGDAKMKAIKLLIITLLILIFSASLAFGEKGGKGRGKAKGLYKQKNHPVQTEKLGTASLQHNLKIDHPHRDFIQESIITVQGTGSGRDKSFERGEKVSIMEYLDGALKKTGNAQWGLNPHDLRGQGNMGRPDMIAPYGHDKDSDRL
jgi:hypothetical protein